MSGFISNSQVYSITTENEIAVILSHFNSQYIFDVIKDSLQKKFNYNTIASPNVVASFEQNFKYLKATYPSDANNIETVRTETYKEIISILCNEYNLVFDFENEEIDYYSAAFYMYDFLVSNFSNYISAFFANFIVKEKNSLYESLNMDSFKKNKDSSTIYSKKIYKDGRLAILNANVDYVIKSISSFDITFTDILSLVYVDRNIVGFMDSIIKPVQDFYKVYYCGIIGTEAFPLIVTNIRLMIQNILKAE